jgi:predicted transcriptional regulator
MRKDRVATIERFEQMAALTSPVRQELLDVMTRMGAVSLAEVAAVLGRPPDGLYYHVRLLSRAGLVRPAGVRRRGKRVESLFRAAAPRFALRYASRPGSHARALNAIVAAMMRLGIRDFRRALKRPGTRLEGPDRELWALRTTGWLLPRQVRVLNRMIRRLTRAAESTTPRGRLYGVTVLLTPLTRERVRRGARGVTTK